MQYWTIFLMTLDDKILMWLQENFRNDILSAFFSFFTHLGDHGEIWIIMILALLHISRYRRTGLTALLSLASTFLLVDFVMKPWIKRVRPYEVIEGLQRLVGPENSYSFPSGHSSTSLAVGYVLLRKLPAVYGIPAFLVAILMAFSRMYVGVHYPSDVIIGALIGIAVGEICIRIEAGREKVV